jgi:hypothetical protein
MICFIAIEDDAAEGIALRDVCDASSGSSQCDKIRLLKPPVDQTLSWASLAP